jgi:hypothetical protein
MDTVARLSVLLSCAAAGGTLLVLLAGARPAGPFARTAAQPGLLPGVLTAALAAYVLLAGGVALTGAARLDAGALATGLRVGGVALLVATAFLAVFVVAPHGHRVPMTVGGLVVLLWAGAALALVSWLLAIGAVLVALVAGVRIEPNH